MRLEKCPTVEENERVGHGHRYPTRWRIGRHTSQAPRVSRHEGLVACKRRKFERRSLYLPTEIMFNILLLIPAKLLHQVVRSVCKQWYHIVSDPLFVTAHRRSSSGGLLVQRFTPSPSRRPFHSYVTHADADADATKFNLIESPIHLPSQILNSYHGLLVLADLKKPRRIHVLNPATNLKISLPPMFGRRDYFQAAGIGINSSGHYKVVLVFGNIVPDRAEMTIFTLGVDKAWRFIDLQGIRKPGSALLAPPLTIAGYLYWNNIGMSCYAMDLDTETMYEFNHPKDLVPRYCSYYMNMETCLGMMESPPCVWRVWKLTDVKSGEWTRVGNINKEPMVSRLNNMLLPSVPKNFVAIEFIDGEFWCFGRVDNEFLMVSYNIINETLRFLPIKKLGGGTNLIPHVHTLVSPMSC